MEDVKFLTLREVVAMLPDEALDYPLFIRWKVGAGMDSVVALATGFIKPEHRKDLEHDGMEKILMISAVDQDEQEEVLDAD